MSPGSYDVILSQRAVRQIDLLTVSIHSLLSVSIYTTMTVSSNTDHLVKYS